MALTSTDKTKINRISFKTIGQFPMNLKYEPGKFDSENKVKLPGNIRFSMNVGEEKTKEVCNALVKAGLQHTPDDGKPEFFLSGAEGALFVNVRWPLDTSKPVWNEE